MEAVVYKKYGGSKVLEYKNIPKPKPEENELLVKVCARTLNRTDCGIIRGNYLIMRLFTGLFKPKLKVIGTDFAGIVEQVGLSVQEYKVGDKVFGFNDTGLKSFAEYLVINKDEPISKVPKDTAFSTAAASLEGFHYACNFVNKVSVKKGDIVFVNGASGAIGSAMIQILISMGATVSASSNTKSIKLLKSLGVSNVVDYTKQNFTNLNEKYDFVFDAVGKSNFSWSKKVLKQGGTYISSELGPFAQNLYLPLLTIFANKKVKFPFPTDIPKSISVAKKLLSKGKFNPLIDKTYKLNNTKEAFDYVCSGKKSGNVVITN